MNEEGLNNILKFEMPDSELDYHTVYTIRTTKPRPDEKIKTEQYNWPGLPPLGQDSLPNVQSALF